MVFNGTFSTFCLKRLSGLRLPRFGIGFPEQISILQNLYQDSKCAVRYFTVLTGVRQGCILSPLLFAIVMDWVMRQSTISRDFGLIWVDNTRLTDLYFADDVVLIDSDVKRLQELTTAVQELASKVGLCEFQ